MDKTNYDLSIDHMAEEMRKAEDKIIKDLMDSRDLEDRLIEELLKPMHKVELIKILTKIIEELCDRDESSLVWKDRKIKFRQYPRLEATDNTLRAIDITIEA